MPTVVQSVAGTATNTTGVLDLTLPSPTTLGNTVAVFAGCSTYITGTDPGPTSCKLGSSAGNFVTVPGASWSGAAAALSTWLDPDCAGSQTTIAVSSYSTADTYYLSGAAFEISGPTASPLDVTDTTGAFTFTGATTFSITGAATAQADELWLGCVLAAQTVTITGPAAPWVNTSTITVASEMAMMAGTRSVSATGTPVYAGTFNDPAQWSASLITLKATPAVTGTGSVALPVRGLLVAGGEKFSGSGAAAMPPRSLSATGHEVFRAAGGVVMPARALAGTGAIDSGVIMPGRSLAASGYVSPIGSGGVVMPSAALAGTGSEVIHGTGSVAAATPSLSGRSVTGDQGSGSVALPSRRLSGSGVTAQQARGSVRMPARALAGSGKVIISGHGGVQARKFTLSGTVGEQPRGSGGVVMPRMAMAGTSHTRLSYVWDAPDKLNRSGGVMS